MSIISILQKTRARVAIFVKENIPSSWWPSYLWVLPLVLVLLQPLAVIVSQVGILIDWAGTGRAAQGMILASVLGGWIVGSMHLSIVDEYGFEHAFVNRVKWLSRMAIIFPLLFFLIAHWIVTYI
jgi:hypothetical protein